MRKVVVFMMPLLFALVSCGKSEQTVPGGDGTEFTIVVGISDISDISASIVFTPSSEHYPYIAGCVRQAELGTVSSSDVKRFIDARLSAMMSESGMTRSEAVSALSVRGDVSMTPDTLASRTEYVCYAVGVNEEGLYVTDAFTESFVTLEEDEPVVELSFTVEVSATATAASVSVDPSDDTLPYYFDLITKEEYDACGGDVATYLTNAIEAAVTSQGLDKEAFVKSLQIRGPDSDNITGLPSDTDMAVYAVGLHDDGTCYGEPETVFFHTKSPGNPEDCEFTFDIVHSASGVDITVIPSDDGIGYFTSVIKNSEYVSDEVLIERVYESIVKLAGEYGITLSQAVERIAVKGADNWLYSDLEEGTDYYAFAYALSSDGKAAGPVAKKQFAVAAYVSDATVSLDNVKWFNGDDLADMDSQYEQLRGRAYFTADVSRSDNAASWFVGVLPGNYSDSERYPDDSVYDAVMMGGLQDRDRIAMAVNYGELSVLGFAIDFDGVYGGVYRMFANITEEGASPVSEFNK